MNPFAVFSLASTFLSSSAGQFVAKVAGGSVAVALVFGAGFYKGDTHRAAVDGTAGAKSKVEFLQRQLAARDEAAKKDAAQAKADLEAMAANLEASTHAQSQATPGTCVSGIDAASLRALWLANPHNGKH